MIRIIITIVDIFDKKVKKKKKKLGSINNMLSNISIFIYKKNRNWNDIVQRSNSVRWLHTCI